jgi:LmbE family N-acetylglucosaminyl deacetylase
MCDVLAIVPHPDDESVYAGGTISGMVDAGFEVRLVVATDGGGGRGGPDLCRRRMRELLGATATLGIRAVQCLGWPDFGKYRDGARSQPFTLVDTLRVWGLETSLVAVVRCIRAHRPNTVLSLDPEVDPNYSLHGHHLALGLLVTVAFHLAADPDFAPHVGASWAPLEHRVMSPLAEADLGEVVEIDRERKRAALLAHASQHYSTASLLRALADASQPAVEVSRRVQVRTAVPFWIARGLGPKVDRGIDWSAEADRVLSRCRPRVEMVDILHAQATQRAGDERVERAIDRLADPRTVAVLTGQQVGLLGGPALTLHKALAAVALAERIERAGVPAVPVFWMATHDHDLEEVRCVPRLDGEPLRLVIPKDGRPVGARRLGDGIGPLLDAWLDALGARSGKLAALLQECFTPDATFASAFARFLGSITRGLGLVILDPSDPRVAALARPVIEPELLGPRRMQEPLALERARLQREHRAETIETTRDVLQLFITDDDGRRCRLRPTASGVAWSGGELDARVAAGLLASEPARFTPAALLRPLMQDVLLPTIAYVAGPTEARYLAQLRGAYASAEIPMPRIVERPRVVPMTHADAAALLGPGSREVLVASEHAQAAIGRAGLPTASRRWLEELEVMIERVAAWRRGTFDPAGLRSGCERLDASARSALAEHRAALRTWSTTSALVAELGPRIAAGDAPVTRTLTRVLRSLVRVRRSLLRAGRADNSAAIAAWRNVSPSPAAPERRASVAEVLARLGLQTPHVILDALRRNFVRDVVVQGEESS